MQKLKDGQRQIGDALKSCEIDDLFAAFDVAMAEFGASFFLYTFFFFYSIYTWFLANLI